MTLDTGQCPKWLFERMVKLGREMCQILIAEYGPDEFVRRMSDPVWFQTLGTVLAFDWNASGLTTILTAALKESIRGYERDLGVFICGGKGKTSRKTPDEISRWGEVLDFTPTETRALQYNSRMSAKVDSSLVQDGFQIYHHSFIFSKNGAWATVQQGMNTKAGAARRYHWFSPSVDGARINADDTQKDAEKNAEGKIKIPRNSASCLRVSALRHNFINEPHQGIASPIILDHVLNLTASDSDKTRDLSTEFVAAGFQSIKKDIEILRKHSSALSKMISIRQGGEQLTFAKFENTEFHYHPVVKEDFSKSKYLEKISARLTEEKPKNYESLIATPGVGPKTVRALALVAEVIYGAKPSYTDPARYSFAHGGKDATPYPVDRETYDKTIEMLAAAVRKTHISPNDKNKALRRLHP